MTEQYIPTRELCRRLCIDKKTVRRRIDEHEWKRGVHYFRPPKSGLVWRWTSIVRWIESEGQAETPPTDTKLIEFASVRRRANGAHA